MSYVDAGYTVALVVIAAYAVVIFRRRVRLEALAGITARRQRRAEVEADRRGDEQGDFDVAVHAHG